MNYAPLPLEVINAFEPLAIQWGVSEVARGIIEPALRGGMPPDWPHSFMLVYKRAKGNINKMPVWWQEERIRFIKRHYAQIESKDEPLFYVDGMPTRRHIALIFWAWSPVPDKLMKLLKRV